MDTPVNQIKAPRRKLKRVLKKNKISSGFSHNISNQSVYQKKLKNAINTSLNLTNNVRTLQANNRSLALQREKLRQEMRGVINEYMNVLQLNQNLNERILELERQLDMTPSIIEHEVDSRCQDKFHTMQCQLDLLIESASTFTKGLTELKQLSRASPRKSGNSSSVLSLHHSTSSSHGDDIMNLPIHSPGWAVRRRLTHKSDKNYDGLQESPNIDRGFVQEMSMVMESSHLEDHLVSEPALLLQVSEELPEEDERMACHVTSSASSSLPQNKLISRLETEGSGDTFMGQLNRREGVASPVTTVRGSRRRGSCFASKTTSPTLNRQNDFEHLKNNQTLTTPEKNQATIQNEEYIQSEAAPVISKSNKTSPVLYHGDISFQKNLTKGKNSTKTKVNKSTQKVKSDVETEDTKSPSLFIRNAFDLMNAHKERLEKREASLANRDPVVTSQTAENHCEELTSHTIKELTTGVFDEPCVTKKKLQCLSTTQTKEVQPDDQIFTREFSKAGISASEVSSKQLKTISSQADFNDGDEEEELINEKSEEESLPTQVRSRGRHGSGSSNSQDTGSQSESASIPEAVKVQVRRGGKLVFAVSRKGADGSRAIVQASIRARSKPKKAQRACLEQSLVQESEQNAQNIFDFHDKTPKSLQQNQHQNAMSVFSLSADESAFSPLGSLDNLRESKKEKGVEKPTAEVFKENAQLVIDEMEPMSSPALEKSQGRKRNMSCSRSRSRKKHFEEQAIDGVLPNETEKNYDGMFRRSSELNPSENSVDGPAFSVVDIASTFVGEVYTEPLKGSPEVKPRYRTRSQSRGRRGRSSGRQSPESVKKARSKSAASSTESPSHTRGRSSIRRRESTLKGPCSETASPVNNGLSVSGKQAGTVDQHMSETVRKSLSRPTSEIRRNRSTVRESRDGNHSEINNAEENQSACDTSIKKNGDFTCISIENRALSEAIAKESESIGNNSWFGLLLEKSPINKNQVKTNIQEKDNRKSKVVEKNRRTRSSSPAIGIEKRDSPLKLRSPSAKPRKEISKRSKSARKAPGDNRKTSIENSSQDSPRLMSGAEEKGDECSETGCKEDHEEEQRISHKKASLRSRAREDGSMSFPQGDKERCANKHKDRESASNNSPNLKSDKRQETTPQGNIKNQPEIPHNPGSKDFNSYDASPGRQANKLRQKEHKSAYMKSKKLLESEDQDNLIQGLESGKGIPYSGECDAQKTESAVSSMCLDLKYNHDVNVAAPENKTTDQAVDEDCTRTFAGLQQNAADSLVIRGDGSQKVQDEMLADGGYSPNKKPKISKIVKNSPALFNFCTAPESISPNREGRKRRAASNVSYVPPRLNSKLRRGDPFTSHYAAETISIYRSPRSKAKEKARLRRDVLGSLHNLAIKESPTSAKTEN